MKKEGEKRDASMQIEEMAVPHYIMALKEEAKNTEEAVLTEERRRKSIENNEGSKQLLK